MNTCCYQDCIGYFYEPFSPTIPWNVWAILCIHLCLEVAEIHIHNKKREILTTFLSATPTLLSWYHSNPSVLVYPAPPPCTPDTSLKLFLFHFAGSSSSTVSVSFELLREAEARLKDLVRSKFNEASSCSDSSSLERYQSTNLWFLPLVSCWGDSSSLLGRGGGGGEVGLTPLVTWNWQWLTWMIG